MDSKTGEKHIAVEGGSKLESRFLLWFSCEQDLTTVKESEREIVLFDSHNSPEDLRENLDKAFLAYKIKFNYTEIPNVVGKSIEEADRILHRAELIWVMERQVFTDKYPKNYVTAQWPFDEVTSNAMQTVRLTISAGPPEDDTNRKVEIEEDEVFKLFAD